MNETLCYIADLESRELRLRRPIEVQVTRGQERWSGFAPDIEELVIGINEIDVVMDMRRAIADVYALLKSEAKNLGPLQKKHWEFLRGIVDCG